MITVTKTENGIVEWALERDPCNEIGLDMLDALETSLDALDLETTRALILHSTQRKGFCAGADLRELHHGLVTTSREEALPRLEDFIHRIHTVMNRLDQLPCTTVAAIHGVCFGGGFELALTADIRVADATARFCFPELRLGIVPGFGGIPRLNRDIGNGIVRDLLLTGRSINAKRAAAIGLVSQQVNRGEALPVARQVALQATRFDAGTTRRAKAFMKPHPAEALEAEKSLFLEMIQQPVVLEGLTAFVENQTVRPYLPGGNP